MMAAKEAEENVPQLEKANYIYTDHFYTDKTTNETYYSLSFLRMLIDETYSIARMFRKFGGKKKESLIVIMKTL